MSLTPFFIYVHILALLKSLKLHELACQFYGKTLFVVLLRCSIHINSHLVAMAAHLGDNLCRSCRSPPFFQIGGVKGGHSSLSLSTRLKPKHFSAFSWGVPSITNLIWLLCLPPSRRKSLSLMSLTVTLGGVQLKVPPEGPVWRRGWCVAYHFAPLAEYYPNLKSTPRFPSEVSNMTLGVLLP